MSTNADAALPGVRAAREPIAWVVLVAVTLGAIVAIVRGARYAMTSGQLTDLASLPIIPLAQVAVLVPVLLLCAAWGTPTRRARVVVSLGALVLTATAAVEVIFEVIAAMARLDDPAGLLAGAAELVRVAVQVAAAAGLWHVAQDLSAPRPEPEPEPAQSAPELPAEAAVPEVQVQVHDPRAGAVWTTAGAAAEGQAADSWGRSAPQSGWGTSSRWTPPEPPVES
ncbi:hypothetical protein [Granulicoccus phenolivorans]|uniref:hypothetical protein n=1 Tax=Granulicoccus phenolivorans TaxID=266854 RepID=UPI000427E244|nr:hypothetical protein [Granulicoccus phenolivorans]